MTETIWIINAMNGEYSDRYEWVVCAFDFESSAQAFCDLLGATARECTQAFFARENKDEYWKMDYEEETGLEDRLLKPIKDLDPNFYLYGDQEPMYRVSQLTLNRIM